MLKAFRAFIHKGPALRLSGEGLEIAGLTGGPIGWEDISFDVLGEADALQAKTAMAVTNNMALALNASGGRGALFIPETLDFRLSGEKALLPHAQRRMTFASIGYVRKDIVRVNCMFLDIRRSTLKKTMKAFAGATQVN